MLKYAKHLALTGAALAFTACGVDENTRDNLTNPDLPDLVGTWKSNCAEAAVLDLAQTTKTLEFQAVGDFVKREAFFSDGTCTAPGLEQFTSGTFGLEGPLESNNSLEKVNFTVDQVRLTARTDQMVTALNTTKFCGLNTWAKDVEVDITGKECLGITSNKGDVIFDVYRINGNELRMSKQFLFLSSDSGDSRPDEVSDDLVYIKQ